MTDRFPEFARAADFLPDGTVIDGEIVSWDGERPLPFSTSCSRESGARRCRRNCCARRPSSCWPTTCWNIAGRDMRDAPLSPTARALDALLSDLPGDAPRCAPRRASASTAGRRSPRPAPPPANRAEGVMLKRHASPYLSGRKKGDWWKWKLDPLTVDAVMIYAQQGSGRRANLFTDFTFAVWNGPDLVPFTKAYSGLTDKEFGSITAWVRRNTLQRFGPVRQVRPEHVFEIAFEGIQPSPRHKSGIALRFPRMARWRHDKAVQEANTLADLKHLLDAYGS